MTSVSELELRFNSAVNLEMFLCSVLPTILWTVEAKCQKNILNISRTEHKLLKWVFPFVVCVDGCSKDMIHKKEKQEELEVNLSY